MRKLLVIVCVLITFHAYADDIQKEQKRLKALQAQIADLTKTLSTNASKQSKLEKALKTLDIEISSTSQELQTLHTQMIQSQKALLVLQQQQAEEQAALNAQQDQLTSQIRSAYLAGQNPALKILLSLDNPYTFSRLLGYYSYFNQARQQEIEKLNASLAAIAQREALINETLAELKTLQNQKMSHFASLQKEQDMREQVLKALNDDMDTHGNRITKLKADASSLNKIIDKLQEKQRQQQAQRGNFKNNKGHLAWPTLGKVTHQFGAPRSGDQVRWNGVFIEAQEGEAVRAVHPGKVVFADWLRGYGLLLIVDHGDNFMSLYAYNQNLYKQVGQQVLANEAIATVGKTGGIPNPGLYFEIRQAGNPIDPRQWMQKQG